MSGQPGIAVPLKKMQLSRTHPLIVMALVLINAARRGEKRNKKGKGR